MRVNVWGKAARAVRRLYPERQIYFRADGAVRFFVLTSRVQMAASAVALIGVAWVGVATASLLLEDEVIAAKERRIEEMAQAYGDLSGEMDRLRNGVLQTTKELEVRQRFLNDLVMDQDTGAAPAAADGPDQSAAPGDAVVTPAAANPTDTGKVTESARRRTSGLGKRIADVAALFTSRDQAPIGNLKDVADQAEAIENRLAGIEREQRVLTARLLARTVANLDEIEQIIRVTGLTGEKLLGALDQTPAGQGGPFIVDASTERGSAGGESGQDNFNRLIVELERLDGLRTALKSLPLGRPAEKFYISSSYGRRIDPFNKRRAMHAAVDLSGPWKTPILATAPGVVTRAGLNGPYGRFVEIDHGHGFKTRYGHMAKILVKKGQEVALGEHLGLMGNSGRATSTHLHYEIWFEGSTRNPAKFFKAAQYVQQQETE